MRNIVAEESSRNVAVNAGLLHCDAPRAQLHVDGNGTILGFAAASNVKLVLMSREPPVAQKPMEVFVVSLERNVRLAAFGISEPAPIGAPCQVS